MKNKNILRLFRNLIVFLALSLSVLLPGIASAAGNAVVSVSAPAGALTPGGQFTISISVTPNNAVAGMQFNLSFNPSIVTAVSVAEGNLLNQGGASTYFNAGQINNTAGTITGVFGAIISPGQTVVVAGTFAVITLTAGSVNGSCPLTLSNVIVGDLQSQSLPVSVSNATITVGTAAPDSPSGGSSGGGGGGGGPSGVTSLTAYMTGEGKFVLDATAESMDGKVTLDIPRGTIGKNRNGQRLYSVSIKENTASPAPPADCNFVCLPYDIGPSGTTFDPPIYLTFKYTDSQVPAGVAEENLVIATWQDGKWVEFEGCVVNPVKNTITVPISHFTIFAVMAHTAPASFEITEMTVEPAEVYADETVTVSATIANNGDLSGTYEANLKLDNDTVPARTVTLNGRSRETIAFTVTSDTVGEHQASLGEVTATFMVKEPLSPAAFTVDGLSISPVSAYSGENVEVSAVVTNTGGLPGTYQTILSLDDVAVETREVAIDSGGAVTVTFSFTTSEVGQHTVSIGNVQASFEVKSPLPTLLPPAVTPESSLQFNSFSAISGYDITTHALTFVRITCQMSQGWESFPDARLMMAVFRDNQFLEQVPLLTLSELQADGRTGELSYTPSQGWQAGEYAFRAELYEGENLVQSTAFQRLTVAPESAAAVVSWKTLGIIIGAVLVLGSFIVTLVLYYRRDTLRDYWQ